MNSVRWQINGMPAGRVRSYQLDNQSQVRAPRPGQSLWYRLVAKDCDGQTTESKIFQLSIAAPRPGRHTETAKPPESLEQLVKLVSQMAQHA